jgi:NAD+ synthase (glutamine-hydrolysing)
MSENSSNSASASPLPTKNPSLTDFTSPSLLPSTSTLFAVPNTKVHIATCNLNQWALDFDGNLERIKQSIKVAKQAGARYRIGPELEISGYECEDHFFEMDTFLHCEQSLADLLTGDFTEDCLCDIGCPLLFNNVRYNCRIFTLNHKILYIRPKTYLADDGNYREKRYFSSWDIDNTVLQDFPLSDLLKRVTGQVTVPFGIAVLATEETKIASEMCEELWTPRSPHINFFLSGVEIISNGSGSHHELRKLESRLNLMKNATSKCGGIYLYSNHRGCNGTRLYFDGSSLIVMNGQILAQASQFSLKDVEVITSCVDLENVRSHRNAINSLQEQASRTPIFPIIDIRHFSLCSMKLVGSDIEEFAPTPHALAAKISVPEEECCKGPACWLWDYLRRSGASGYLLPLSGGADSAAVAAIVKVMCTMVAQEIVLDKNSQVFEDVKRMFGHDQEILSLISTSMEAITGTALELLRQDSSVNMGGMMDDQSMMGGLSESGNHSNSLFNLHEQQWRSLSDKLCRHILHTVYLGSKNSSWNTQDRAYRLAKMIDAYHNTMYIDDIVSSILKVFSLLAGKVPRFHSQGGTMAEDLALQNIQARIRMVLSYLCAQLFPWLRGNKGFLLVLGSANVDEALRGYMTKYDCSSADLNPIGGMCKGDLKRMLVWVSEKYNVDVLKEIAYAAPTVSVAPVIEGDYIEVYFLLLFTG